MSIAFDKRDYVYTGDDIEDEQVSDDEDEETSVTEQTFEDKIPNEWVFDLMDEMKRIAHFHAVCLLDRCETSSFAEFLANYSEDVFEKRS